MGTCGHVLGMNGRCSKFYFFIIIFIFYLNIGRVMDTSLDLSWKKNKKKKLRCAYFSCDTVEKFPRPSLLLVGRTTQSRDVGFGL